METLTMIGQILMIIAFLGFIAACICVGVAAITLKNGAVKSAKRLYERPMQAFKNLTVTGKGIAQQETVRAQNMGRRVKKTVGVVRETVDETRGAVEGINFADLKPLLANLQQIIKIANLVNQTFKSTARQK